MLSSMSLRTKVLGAVVGALVLGFALSFAVLIYNATQLQTATALAHAQELARYEAQRVSTKLEKALQLSRAYAVALNQLRLDGTPSRAQALQLLKGMVAGHPEYVGASTGWEPNAFDGKDAAFVGTPFHDSTGRFMPYLFRDERGQVAVEVLVGYDKPGEGDYYLIPKSTRKPAIIEPYLYAVNGVDTLMTTLATPVLEGDKFLGLLCIDMSLSHLQQHIQGVLPYGNGHASVVSYQGVYVADKVAQSIGKPLALGDLTPQLVQSIQKGQEWVHEGVEATTGEELLRIFTPIRVHGVDTPWALGLTIPTASILARVHAMRWIALALGVGSALLVIAVAAVVLQRMVLRPLGGEPQEAAHLAARVAEGDFSAPVALQRAHPGSVMAQLARMQQQLSALVLNVRYSAQGVALASGEISQGNLDLSQRTESQASALEETSASMEQLNVTVQQNADRSRSASTLATQAAQVARQGGQAMEQMLTSMHAMSASSQQIGDIIGVIDSIAFQTNILALNAAVEAARAGEQGRGFAVVASEVRSLAGRSAEAAKQIKQLIANSVTQVQAGSAQAEQVGHTMEQVVEVIGKVASLMAEVSSAGGEQSSGVAQVGEAVSHIDSTTQKNAALVEEMAAAAAGLNSRAAELVQLVAVFRLAQDAGASAAAGVPQAGALRQLAHTA